MTITFENDNDIIVYAFGKIISYAGDNQYIFLAQSVWWISSILKLQEELVIHIHNLKKQYRSSESSNKATKHSSLPGVHPSRVTRIQNSNSDYTNSEHESISTIETDIHNEVIDHCEIFQEQSKQQRKAIGRITRQASRVAKWRANKEKPIKTFRTQREGIDSNELRRRKAAGECQHCAWPQNRKGNHKTLDCLRWEKLEKGTESSPKK